MAHAPRHPVDPAALPRWPRPFDPAFELDWGDPTFSRRLLREHLDQSTDSASRRLHEVGRHLRRLDRLLPAGPLDILDAACGPGLYAVPLAERGHRVTGVDVGPAVLRHARALARRAGVSERTRFVRADLGRSLPSRLAPGSVDVVLLVYFVVETFPRPEQAPLLRRLGTLLRPGGLLIAELRVRPDQPAGRLSSWHAVDTSILSDRPHLLLTDTTWDERRRIHVLREIAVAPGAVTAQQTSSALSSLGAARHLVAACDLRLRAVYDGWSRYRATGLSSSLLVVARRPPGARRGPALAP